MIQIWLPTVSEPNVVAVSSVSGCGY